MGKSIHAQFARPSFAGADLHYVLFSDLTGQCDGMGRFSQDHRAVLKIARRRPV